jgi:phosphotriesterase-related protein
VQRGAWIQFDTVQGVHEWDTQQRLGWLRSLADAGHLGRVLLSQDVCLRSDYVAMGGPGYAYVVTTFADRLREAGFDDADVATLTVDNPRRMLTGE